MLETATEIAREPATGEKIVAARARTHIYALGVNDLNADPKPKESNGARAMVTESRGVSLDHLAIPIYVRVDAAPDDSTFRVTIQVPQVELVVEAIEHDVADAIHAAASLCAGELHERGYSVTPAEILAALESIDDAASARTNAN